jgi:hypothetical protein
MTKMLPMNADQRKQLSALVRPKPEGKLMNKSDSKIKENKETHLSLRGS